MDDIIAITGHRNYPDPGSFYRGLNNLSADRYYLGGARGADTDALEYLGRTQPGSQRTVVVSNRLIDQPAATRPITQKYATDIIELRNNGANRFQVRNQYMVDRSTHLRAFYDGRGSGGTYNTIQYAKSTGKPYSIWHLDDYDNEHYLSMDETAFREWMKNAREHQTALSSIKSIITAYFKAKYKNIPQDIVLELGSWRLTVWW